MHFVGHQEQPQGFQEVLAQVIGLDQGDQSVQGARTSQRASKLRESGPYKAESRGLLSAQSRQAGQTALKGGTPRSKNAGQAQ